MLSGSNVLDFQAQKRFTSTINKKGVKKVSIVLPVYNEEKTIANVIEAVSNAPILGLEKEIIVVNDGSKDNTKQILDKIKNDYINLRIYHKENGGKGSALRFGINKARGHIVIPQDADLELNPSSFESLIKPILENKTKIVFGYRNWHKSCIPFHSKAANFIVTFLANFLYGANIKDEACGYKVLTRDLYRSLNLKSKGFEICPETLSKVMKLGYKIESVPVQFKPRKFSEGKKISWKDGWTAIWSLIKFRFQI